MSLTILQVRNSKAVDKYIKLSDGGGLFILLKPNGSKYWRLAYRYQNKQKTLSLGVYPEVSLLEARQKTLEAKKQLKNGIDPSAQKKLFKLTTELEFDNSFASVANEWFVKQQNSWVDSHKQMLNEGWNLIYFLKSEICLLTKYSQCKYWK